MSLKKSLYSFYFLGLLSVPLGFLIRIFYSKTLPLEDFGLIYALISFFTFISIFSRLGLEQSILYFFPKYIEKKNFSKIRDVFFSILILVVLISLIEGFFIFISSNYLEFFFFKYENIKYFLILFFFYNFLSNIVILQTQFFITFKKVFLSQIFYVVRLVIILFFSYIVFFLNVKNIVLYYSFSWLISIIVMFLVSFYYFKKEFPFMFEKKPKFKKKLLKKFIKFGFFGISINVGNMILAQIDILVITYFLLLSDVAVYSNSIAVISILFLLTTPLSMLFLPLFSEYKEKKNYKLMNKIINLIYTYGFFLILPVSLIFFIYPKLFLTFLFSSDFSSGFIILKIFAIFSIFKILYQYNINFMIGLGLIKETTLIVVITALLNLVLDIIFLNFFGMLGVALATGIAWFSLFLSSFYYLKYHYVLKIEINFISILKTIFLGFIFLVLIEFLKTIVLTSFIYFNMVIILSIAFLFYFFGGYFMKIYKFSELYDFLPEKVKLFFKKDKI